MATENGERLTVRVFLGGELIMRADLSPEMTIAQVEEWAQRMVQRGCTVCFKRLPAGDGEGAGGESGNHTEGRY